MKQPSFSESLKSERKRLGKSQPYTAGLIGCPVSTLREYEHGRRVPAAWVQRLVLAHLSAAGK